jgi:hypothetical protein
MSQVLAAALEARAAGAEATTTTTPEGGLPLGMPPANGRSDATFPSAA